MDRSRSPFHALFLATATLLGTLASGFAEESLTQSTAQSTAQRNTQSEGAPPNLLLITVDTLRPDALGWIDAERSTPAIDAIARGGFRFPAAVAPVPLTLPSHATILTGLEPDRHGVRDNGQVLSESVETLAERLAEAGYATGAFVGGYPLSQFFGTDQGFAHFDDEVDEGEGAWLERPAPKTTEAALAWLRSARTPWLLWVHFYDPHLPYDPPPELLGKGSRGAYDGEVALVDRAIGRLREAQAVRKGSTLTIFAADHGESLGEHGEASHGYFIYESTMRVPLLIHWPGRVAPGESVAPARLADVTPTVLDLLGLPAIDDTDGVSLVPLVDGEAFEIPPAAIESMQPWSSYGWAPLRGVRRNDWKYIAAPRPELYDLASDPGERRNLVAAQPETARELRALVGEPGVMAPTTDPTSFDSSVAARLRALGYVSSGSTSMKIPEGLADPKDQLPLRDLLTQVDGAIEAGDLRRAVQLADRVLAEDPKNRFALSRSAYALVQAGFADRGIRRFERVVELDPEQSESRTLLAEALTRSGEFDRAIHHWRELVARGPDNSHLWSQLGSTLGMAGRTAEAVEALETGLALDSQDNDLRTRLAFAHYANGEPSAAVASLHEVSAQRGVYFEHYGTLGVFLLAADKPEYALPQFQKSRPEHADYAEGRYEWARWAALRDDLETARRALGECLASRPDLRAKAAADPVLAVLLPDLAPGG